MTGAPHVALVGPYADRTNHGGGVQSSLTRLAHGLADAGVPVTVLAPAPGTDDDSRVPVIRLTGATGLPLSQSRWLYARAFRPWRQAVAARLRDLAPDLVHAQGLLAHGLAAGDWRDGPRVVTAHGNPWRDVTNSQSGPRGQLAASLAVALAVRSARRADLVIGASADPSVNLHCRPRRFVHIPNIVDEAFFKVSRTPVPGRVLYCGGSRRIKGWDVLAAAWPVVARAVPGAELVALGVEPEHTAGLPAVRTLPMLPPDDLAEQMSGAAALVLPSRYEVAPMVVAEAWAAGVPVVAAGVGGVPAMAAGAAVLVGADDPAALAAALRGVLEPGGSEHVSDLREEGRQRAELHRTDQVIRRHVEVYEGLLGRRPVPEGTVAPLAGDFVA